jgi:hypothetical protein
MSPLYRLFHETTTRFQDVIIWVTLKVLYHQTSDYQPLHRYEHFSVLYDTVLYRFLWPSFKLTPHLWRTPIPVTSRYLCTVFVHMTVAVQLTACLPHAGRKVTECLNRHYPSCWIGRFGLQAWPAKSPHFMSLDYFL